MPKRISETEKTILLKIALLGGVDVNGGSLRNSGPLTPVYCALEDLKANGYVTTRLYGVRCDGAPNTVWSLSNFGRKQVEKLSSDRLSSVSSPPLRRRKGQSFSVSSDKMNGSANRSFYFRALRFVKAKAQIL